MKSPITRLAPLASAVAFAAVSLSLAQAQTAPAPALPAVPAAASAAATYPALPSDTPAEFTPVTTSFNYVKRTVMVPMRDGVKLNTVIVIPRNAKGAPVLLTRTPYDAGGLTSHAESSDMKSILQGYDNAADVIVEGGYIRVVQDVRGKYGSEGDYVMNRPLSGPQNATPVDHSTDTWDTIEWLTKNLPESNGKVGIIGISYDGFLPLMALVNPHPALKVAVPMNPMVDGWMGDDWFHHGAFRQINLSYVMEQVVTRKNDAKWFTSTYDDYDTYLRAGSAGELARQRGLQQSGFWRKIVAHPTYDAFWREQAVDKILAKQPVTVPTMLVHSLWDAEDIYGAIAMYKAIKPNDSANDKVFLVMGPWSHGGGIGDGSKLGALNFNSDTALHFRQEILRPFLDRYLKDGPTAANAPTVAPVSAFETGTNKWRSLASWPSGCASGCAIKPAALRLAAGQRLALGGEAGSNAGKDYDEYVADPAKPVPYRARPMKNGYDEAKGQSWPRWLADDQREASGRTDVLTFTSDILTAPLKISGEPIANLIASTSGTDSDWVVKVIDLYPDQVADQPAMGGYQLMISADIFRGRYRESYETARPIAANKALAYRFALPTANHVFLPGHRIMVQIQSSWFPLYDRNPQTFVPSIFDAKPGDYKKATQRIYHSSYVELPVVEIAK
ncbi:CocE/NonD family hydrolase [Massilia psychrophila]|uniref:Glutaryl-7-ACA acylase n=1 Tax=Massilia psychrophila TaxID=1603353 RepID=A0A2G8T552_9BURK|nr:CocE/NonD family hydrolase [Massilia psychrophila]PIL41103.1 glutaryl-7-ACA acylase [Massilia psychrophila]GGE66510.1 glutaryl-7-ACA acylase [Massilia psychrophila]